jgi:hypothetical protein
MMHQPPIWLDMPDMLNQSYQTADVVGRVEK